MAESGSTLRIAVTADLHYGLTRPHTIAALVERIAAHDCDVVLIAGDIGEPDHHFRDALRLFAGLTVPRALVAGNHDLWAAVYPSRYLWEDVLPHITRTHGFRWLDNENLIIGPVGICGTVGWYDYSAKDPRLTNYDDDRYAREKARYNFDALKIDWPLSDREFAAEVLDSFRRRIRHLQDDPAVEQIVVLTHVPPFPEQVIRKPDDFFWNVNNAYFGNLTLGEVIRPFDKVRLVVSGHTHVPVDVDVAVQSSSGLRQVRIITVGSQYYRPEALFIDLPL